MSIERSPQNQVSAVQVYIGLGSNLNDPQSQLEKAIEQLRHHPDVQHWQCSEFYASKPQGPQDQPDFVNAVAGFETHLSPLAVLDLLQSVEQSLGKQKVRHWGERCIDLDLLLHGETLMQTERLTLPHPFMTERDFVLLPLQSIAPTIKIPQKNGEPLAIESCLNQLQQTFVSPL